MKKTIIILILILGLGIGGSVWWQRHRQANIRQTTTNLKTSIDRGIDPTNRARLEAKVKEITDKLGDRKEAKDLGLWLDLGINRSLLGDLAGARDAYQIAIELNAIAPVPRANLGDVLAEMGDLAGAEDAYRKTIELAPSEMYVHKYANFLQTYVPNRKGDYEQLLQNAVQVYGQQASFISRLAQFYEAEGRLEEAKTHLEVLVRLLPDDMNAKKDLARIEKQLQQQ